MDPEPACKTWTQTKTKHEGNFLSISRSQNKGCSMSGYPELTGNVLGIGQNEHVPH
jgi:hypothetical protein